MYTNNWQTRIHTTTKRSPEKKIISEWEFYQFCLQHKKLWKKGLRGNCQFILTVDVWGIVFFCHTLFIWKGIWQNQKSKAEKKKVSLYIKLHIFRCFFLKRHTYYGGFQKYFIRSGKVPQYTAIAGPRKNGRKVAKTTALSTGRK